MYVKEESNAAEMRNPWDEASPVKKMKVGEDGKVSTKSAAQIVQEQGVRALPGIRKGTTRRVYPLVSLNPYEGNWTIKVRVTSKGPMRSFTNARGTGNVFNVELTDKEGTQIQATMFKEAADKFYDKLQIGKLYFISKGSLRAANKRFSSINNDYEMTLNQNSEVEEIPELEDCPTNIPFVKYNFVKIEDLGPYVNGKRLVDVVGVIQSVGASGTVRRKINNEEIPKRDITIVDQSGKTVVLTLWNDLANDEGSKLADNGPIIVARAVRVSDFQGVSLSTSMSSTILIDPTNIPDAQSLREWYDDVGKTMTFAPAGASLPSGANGSTRQSSTPDRATLFEVTQPEVGQSKPAWFTVRTCISFIKPDQAMWYLACTSCNRKVTQEGSSSFWCAGCEKSYESCNRRYILMSKISDYSGEGWICAFNEQAESILGCAADHLSDIRSSQGDDGKEYTNALKKASWVPKMMGISVAQTEYMGEKRQRITVRSVGPVDWAAESKLVLGKIAAMN